MTNQTEKVMSYTGTDFREDFEMNLAEIDIIESEHHDGTMETLFDSIDDYAKNGGQEEDENVESASSTFGDLVDWVVAHYLIDKELIEQEEPYKNFQGESDVAILEKDDHFVISSRTKPSFGENLGFRIYADLKRSDYNDDEKMQELIDHICKQVDEQLVQETVN